MARGIPNYDGDDSSYDATGGGGGGGSGRQYITQYSSLNRGTMGDVFFGTDDIKDTRDLMYKEDVLESYRQETAMKSLRRQSKKGSISSFGCVEILKLLFCCCRCII
ncbi:hypothetical protein REPUB_Repub08aG0005700 [Reevesia pubescens]